MLLLFTIPESLEIVLLILNRKIRSRQMINCGKHSSHQHEYHQCENRQNDWRIILHDPFGDCSFHTIKN